MQFKFTMKVLNQFQTQEEDLPFFCSGFTKYGRVKKHFGDRLPEIREGVILDAGCSYGKTTLELAVLYPKCKIFGIDICGERLPRSIHPYFKERVEFKQDNFYRLSEEFPDNFFSGIFVMNNLVYLSKRLSLMQHERIAHQLKNSLKEGGYLCMSGFGRRHEEDAAGQFGIAVFQKSQEKFREIFLSDSFRDMKYFGELSKVYK